jgi:hypothetical protein
MKVLLTSKVWKHFHRWTGFNRREETSKGASWCTDMTYLRRRIFCLRNRTLPNTPPETVPPPDVSRLPLRHRDRG